MANPMKNGSKGITKRNEVIVMCTGSSRAAQKRYRERKRAEKNANGAIKGNVSFEKIISMSDNSLSLTGTPTIFKKVGKNVVVANAKKSTMGEVLDEMGVKDFVMDSYADKKLEKDLKRLNEAGFEVVAWNIGAKEPDSNILPKNYYYMRKRG